MPTPPTYPGVYVEEVPSGVRTITGVATSIAAFVGYFTRGPMEEAVQIFSMGDFEREFGGLNSLSEASYAIQQFFLNGGTEAWVVRTASGGVSAASVDILSDINGSVALSVVAGRGTLTNPGAWGNNLRVSIDYPTPASGDRFSMTISLVEVINGQEVTLSSEVFNGLTMDSTDSSHFVEDVLNDEFSGSKLVRVTVSGSQRPLQNGTVSGLLDPFPELTTTETTPQLIVTIGTEGRGTARFSSRPESLQDARRLLETAIRSARPELRAFSQASVAVVDNRLRILAGPATSDSRLNITTTETDTTTAVDLGLSTGTQLQGVISGILSDFQDEGNIQISIGRSGPVTLELEELLDSNDPPNHSETARAALETAIRESDDDAIIEAEREAFANARVAIHTQNGENRLIVLSGLPGKSVTFTSATDDVNGLALETATPISALLSSQITTPSAAADDEVNISIGGLGAFTAVVSNDANNITTLATELESAIRAADAVNSPVFTEARVAPYASENRLIVLPGMTGNVVYFADFGSDLLATDLRLTTDASSSTADAANLQRYRLGMGAAIPNTAQGVGTVGTDGNPPDADALILGMQALDSVDLFNILCIPRAVGLEELQTFIALTWAKNVCEDRRAFLIIDTPPGIDDVQEIKNWRDENSGLRSKNAAIYFPRVQIPDPLNDFKLRSVGACGTIAGLYARTDSDRGVWKAPAGTEATLANVFRLERTLTDPENGTLNKLGINCLRTFPIYGTICWGARTMDGADEVGSEYKYVPVRRLALFIEETLFRALKWVVFEPNDEPLWAQIRLNVGAFMNNLFRQGAFQGQTPRQAYLVKCDKETTTQNDIDQGIVNIVVGFAPLKPAEFVYIKLQQLAGQIQT